jgi:hypothetical protein
MNSLSTNTNITCFVEMFIWPLPILKTLVFCQGRVVRVMRCTGTGLEMPDLDARIEKAIDFFRKTRIRKAFSRDKRRNPIKMMRIPTW